MRDIAAVYDVKYCTAFEVHSVTEAHQSAKLEEDVQFILASSPLEWQGNLSSSLVNGNQKR